MKNKGIIVFICLAGIAFFQVHDSHGADFYRTFEIIAISESGLTLRDSDGNVIEVAKDPGDFKVGYKVRYDTVRKRLREYRWQDYKVVAVTDEAMTLKHKTGDILTLEGHYSDKYDVGDQVRYDSVAGDLQFDDDSGEWQQYTILASSPTEITLESTTGEQVTLYLDNNLYSAPRGLFIGMYQVGDPVRYNAATNELRKDMIRTYDWKYYEVKGITENKIILVDENREELILENTYGTDVRAGDRVRYDQINDLLKKVR